MWTPTNRELADGVGFEPTRGVTPCRFSRPVPSTTRAPIRWSGMTWSIGNAFSGVFPTAHLGHTAPGEGQDSSSSVLSTNSRQRTISLLLARRVQGLRTGEARGSSKTGRLDVLAIVGRGIGYGDLIRKTVQPKHRLRFHPAERWLGNGLCPQECDRGCRT